MVTSSITKLQYITTNFTAYAITILLISQTKSGLIRTIQSIPVYTHYSNSNTNTAHSRTPVVLKREIKYKEENTISSLDVKTCTKDQH